MTLPDTPEDSSSEPPLYDARLRDYALSYLARFPVSTQRMRIVLTRRAQAKEQHLTEQGLTSLLEQLQELGYLNDAQFALARARGLLRRGASFYEIRGKLAHDGILSAQIQETLAQIEQDSDGKEELELLQALKVARKRRLGPFRTTLRDNSATSDSPHKHNKDNKDLLALTRKGFSFATIKKLFAASEEELLDWQKKAEEH